jgi:hypothetical protein
MILAEVTGRHWSEREVAAGNIVLLATDEGAQAAVAGNGAGVDLAVVALRAGADILSHRGLAGGTR